MLECVVNVSEGRRLSVLEVIRSAAGADLLDVHCDPDHHRAVFTLVGEAAPRAVAAEAVAHLDLRAHEGVHPRLGVVDVVPFVPLAGSTMADATRARDDFASWAAGELQVPSFLYGAGSVGDAPRQERTLPEIRRGAWRTLAPDVGPRQPHPTAGAICVGAREPLVAYNVWLASGDVEQARLVAATIRGPHIRALGLGVGGRAQVSMNLVAPTIVGPAAAYDLVAGLAEVDGGELVGLVPAAVLAQVPQPRWNELDLAADRTIEARLSRSARSS